MSGAFEIDGEWLLLHSPLGEHRVRLGVATPRKLAARLLKNLCEREAAAGIGTARFTPSVSERAREQIDAQRDRISEMPASDPMRPSEERVLDQMIETSRAAEVADVILKPANEAEDASALASSASGPRPSS